MIKSIYKIVESLCFKIMGPYRCDKKHNDASLLNNEVQKDEKLKQFLGKYGPKLALYMDRGYRNSFSLFQQIKLI